MSLHSPSADFRPAQPGVTAGESLSAPEVGSRAGLFAAPPLMRRDTPWWLLLVGATAICALVLIAPWAASRGSSLAGWLYLAFFPVCHQIGERSFQCFGHALAVCHRCSGLYAGFTLGLLALPALPRWQRRLLAEPRWLLLFAAPMALDVFLWQNVWWSRVASGLLAAFPVSLFVWAALEQLVRHHRNAKDEP